MLKYFVILILIVVAWCPWLKPEEVIQIIDTRGSPVWSLEIYQHRLCQFLQRHHRHAE
ncbi:MAG: hypothetical protein UU01_C0035G0005 [Parcubacteria group bacterium GW2011_GWA2_40_37]|nr:MAG: hypothetical protein UU01_C0035G0005 [Parcubacteria group bacterium GW2011_GWA2_40_37]